MDMVCKIGHKSLFLKLSTNFVSVQDNPSETSVSSFQMSTYILNCMFQYQYVCKNMKETIQKFGFLSMIKKLQNNMKKYTICDHYKFHQLFVTNSIKPIIFNILINVTNLNNAIYNILVVM